MESLQIALRLADKKWSVYLYPGQNRLLEACASFGEMLIVPKIFLKLLKVHFVATFVLPKLAWLLKLRNVESLKLTFDLDCFISQMNQQIAFLFHAEGIAAGSGIALLVEKRQQSRAVLNHQNITPKVEFPVLEKKRIPNVNLDHQNLLLKFVDQNSTVLLNTSLFRLFLILSFLILSSQI